MSKPNVIQRRDVNPLLFKACEVVKYYEKAANCIVSVLGPDCKSVKDSRHPKAMLFCTLCKRFQNNSQKELSSGEYPCTGMHRNAINEARRLGGSYIYTCPVGFIFWTSPIYSGERFAGALMSGGILAVDHQQAEEKIFNICGGEVPHGEIEQYLKDIPEKNCREVKALAQMMLICAEQISDGESRSMASESCSRAGNHRTGQMNYSAAESPLNLSAGKPPGENDNSMDKERMLLASLRRGDNEEARKILAELADILWTASGGRFEYFKLRAIELIVMLSRAAANPEADDEMVETNNRYLKKIEDSKTVEEVIDSLSLIIGRISGKIFSFHGIRHASALRKAERFIWEHYTRKISLQEVATVSGLSAPYFSTVFKDEMGENLSDYLNRLRVEKASAMLRETELSINEIAAACGFEDQSWFSKIFKSFTGFSPGKYRENGGVISPENSAAKFVMRTQRSLPVSPVEFN